MLSQLNRQSSGLVNRRFRVRISTIAPTQRSSYWICKNIGIEKIQRTLVYGMAVYNVYIPGIHYADLSSNGWQVTPQKTALRGTLRSNCPRSWDSSSVEELSALEGVYADETALGRWFESNLSHHLWVQLNGRAPAFQAGYVGSIPITHSI